VRHAGRDERGGGTPRIELEQLRGALGRRPATQIRQPEQQRPVRGRDEVVVVVVPVHPAQDASLALDQVPLRQLDRRHPLEAAQLGERAALVAERRELEQHDAVDARRQLLGRRRGDKLGGHRTSHGVTVPPPA